MSLFSKRPQQQPTSPEAKNSPEQAALTEPTPWAMTEEQYKELHRMLDKILDNQVIGGNNARRLEAKIDSLHSDVRVSIDNELLLIRRQDDQTRILKQIQHTINK